MDLSASMIVDKKISPNLMAFKKRYPSVWVPDSRATNCYSCKATFGLITRKHHCRICGRIFCYACSNNSEVPVSYLDKWDGASVKMCDECHSSQKQAKTVEALIYVLAAMPVHMEEKWKCRLISKDWNIAWGHFSEVRHIQYKIPYKKYNRIEQLWLENNCFELDKHNRLMIAYAVYKGALPPKVGKKTYKRMKTN